MKQAICFKNTSHPTSPKQLSIVVISAQRACDLNAEWHSRLPYIHPSNVTRNRYYVCYAAKYSFEVYAAAIWSSPVARFLDINTTLELRRMAIRDEAPKNTATWMLSKMIKDIKDKFPSLTKLVSYQDTKVHKGTIYKAGNWYVGGHTKFGSWNESRPDRNKDQSDADKIRWEYLL